MIMAGLGSGRSSYSGIEVLTDRLPLLYENKEKGSTKFQFRGLELRVRENGSGSCMASLFQQQKGAKEPRLPPKP